jgi:hypothetical protein
MAADRQLDLFVYHDLTDSMHDGSLPSVGTDAGQWFGQSFEGLFVTAIGKGVHDGRTTVVLSNEYRPDMQQNLKAYFDR